MSSVAAAFRLARAGWVLVREGVVAALPGEELSGMPKFGWQVARLFTRRRALSYQRGDDALADQHPAGPGKPEGGGDAAHSPTCVKGGCFRGACFCCKAPRLKASSRNEGRRYRPSNCGR